MTKEEARERLSRLVGAWSTEATHPALPGVVVHGTTVVEWLEGERFLVLRGKTDHQDFPDAISVLGDMGSDRAETADAGGATLAMHYFDSRGVFRAYQAAIDGTAWRLWRDAPGFSQRFTGTFGAGGNVIDGQWEACEDGVQWKDDVRITYRRAR